VSYWLLQVVVVVLVQAAVLVAIVHSQDFLYHLEQVEQSQLVAVVHEILVVVAAKHFHIVHQAVVVVKPVTVLVHQVVQVLVVHLLHLAAMLLVQETLVVTAL
jgi:hypothetical protein